MKRYFFEILTTTYFLGFAMCCILTVAGVSVPIQFFVISGLGAIASFLGINPK